MDDEASDSIIAANSSSAALAKLPPAKFEKRVGFGSIRRVCTMSEVGIG